MSINPSLKIVTVRNKAVLLLSLICVSVVAGCASTRKPLEIIDPELYASGTAYTYEPLNPTTVWIRDPTLKEIKAGYLDADETSNEFKKALLRDLDTETVRIALNTLGGDAKFNAGVVGVSVAGQSYVLVVDYIKYITSSKTVDRSYKVTNAKGIESEKQFKGTVPIYTGIGLRVRAEFQAHQSGLNISGLPAIAFAATSNGISGRLTVQTLGITGQEVTSLMPIISDISIASIQSAVQSVAAIKAKIYEDSTTVYPKIVGFETPSPDPALVRAITEEIYASEEWICPVIKQVKNLQGKTEKILWIDWNSPPPDEEKK
jgi:hypothetical protein